MSEEKLIGLVDMSLPENRLAMNLTNAVYDMLDSMVAKRNELGLSRLYVAKQIGVREDSIERLENYGDGSIFLLKCYAFIVGMSINFEATEYNG